MFHRYLISEAQRWLSRDCVESHANTGTCIRALRKQFGTSEDASEAWCALFVSVCIANAVKASNAQFRFTKSQSAYGLFRELLNAGIPQIPHAKIGAVFVRQRGTNGGHTGIICGIDEKYVYAIEGNTRGTSNRTGIDRVAVVRYTPEQTQGWQYADMTVIRTLQLLIGNALAPESANFTPSLAQITLINAGSYTQQYAMPIVGMLLVSLTVFYYSQKGKGKKT